MTPIWKEMCNAFDRCQVFYFKDELNSIWANRNQGAHLVTPPRISKASQTMLKPTVTPIKPKINYANANQNLKEFLSSIKDAILVNIALNPYPMDTKQALKLRDEEFFK